MKRQSPFQEDDDDDDQTYQCNISSQVANYEMQRCQQKKEGKTESGGKDVSLVFMTTVPCKIVQRHFQAILYLSDGEFVCVSSQVIKESFA